MGERRVLRAVGALLVVVGIAGCGAGTPAAPTATSPAPEPADRPDAGADVADGQIVAIPPDGTDPGTALDVGGPDLEQRCVDGDLPLPVDLAASSISCESITDDVDVTMLRGRVAADVTFDPGTYWVVLACSGSGGYTFGSDVPGLVDEVEVTCDPDGRAVRQELGTVAESTVGDVTGGPTGPGVYASWVVREGKTTP